jgi:hypothetical protein
MPWTVNAGGVNVIREAPSCTAGEIAAGSDWYVLWALHPTANDATVMTAKRRFNIAIPALQFERARAAFELATRRTFARLDPSMLALQSESAQAIRIKSMRISFGTLLISPRRSAISSNESVVGPDGG